MSTKYDMKYKFLRPVIIFLYNFKCQLCKASPSDFEVHHLDHNNKNNDPFNLIPLCPKCHLLIHSGKIKYSFTVPRWVRLDLERVAAFIKRF